MVWAIDFSTYAQVDKKKLDSLSRLIDSSAHAYKSQQDSVIRHVDSTYKYDVNKAIQQKKSDTDVILTEQKRKADKERQEAILRIVISIALFIIGIVVWLRKRKIKS